MQVYCLCGYGAPVSLRHLSRKRGGSSESLADECSHRYKGIWVGHQQGLLCPVSHVQVNLSLEIC